MRQIVPQRPIRAGSFAWSAGCQPRARFGRVVRLRGAGSPRSELGATTGPYCAKMLGTVGLLARPLALCAMLVLWPDPAGAVTPEELAAQKRLESLRDDIQDLLRSWGGLGNIQVEIVRKRVLVHGRVKRRNDAARIIKAVSQYPRVSHLVRMPSPAQEAAGDMARILPLGVRAQAAGGVVILAGEVYDERSLKLVKSLAEEELKVDEQSVKVLSHVVLREPRYRPKVEIAFYFVELSQNDLDTMGIQWSDQIPLLLTSALSYQSAGVGTNPFSRLAGLFTGQASTVGAVSQFEALINALRRRGRIQVHDHYRTAVSSGETAKYVREGVIYIPVTGVEKADLKEVPFGVNVEVTPTVRTADRIDTALKARISQLTVPVGGDLTVMEERADTTLALGVGEVVAIWQAVERTATLAKRRVPGLGEVPVLGKLFRSSDFQEGRTESALFVHARFTRKPDVFDLVLNRLKEWPTE